VDEIAAVFWSFQGTIDERFGRLTYQTGIIVVEKEQLHLPRLRDFLVQVVHTELDLLNEIVDVIVDLDPDIITGWEVQAASWGYLNSRGRHYGELSRNLSSLC
jgi:DNA polymerase zeta